MIITEPGAWLINPPDYAVVLSNIEQAGRVCYKSENKIAGGSAETFIKSIIQRGHEAVLEHGSLTLKFVCDRGVSHEIVRHRLASYCQESTRYCNYSGKKFGGEITVIRPNFLIEGTRAFARWRAACESAEKAYFSLLDWGCTPQEARAVLPNSLKTEIVMTANIREWRHFLRLRCGAAAHPQMRQVANMASALLRSWGPVFFEDLDIK